MDRLQNDDALGLRVDLLAEVLLEGGTAETKIGQGQLGNQPSGSSRFTNAIPQQRHAQPDGVSHAAPMGPRRDCGDRSR